MASSSRREEDGRAHDPEEVPAPIYGEYGFPPPPSPLAPSERPASLRMHDSYGAVQRPGPGGILRSRRTAQHGPSPLGSSVITAQGRPPAGDYGRGDEGMQVNGVEDDALLTPPMPQLEMVSQLPQAWESSTYIPVHADENDHLLAGAIEEEAEQGGDMSENIAEMRNFKVDGPLDVDLEDAEEEASEKAVLMLGCSIFFITAVVFVIVVSGLMTLVARRSVPRFTVFSDWPDGGVIPLKYGCHAAGGDAQSFPLHWRNVPPTAKSLVILFGNPGRIRAMGIDPVRWFVTDIPLEVNGKRITSIPANASRNCALLPQGSVQRKNVHSLDGMYDAPCAVNGSSLYVIHVYAVDASPVIEDYRDAREVMNRFVGIPSARFRGLYGGAERDIGSAVGKHSHGPYDGPDVDPSEEHAATGDASSASHDTKDASAKHDASQTWRSAADNA